MPPEDWTPTERITFGIDARGVEDARRHGVNVTFGSVWVGAWNLEDGWRGTEEALRRMASNNVTPFVHFYYWGDDISIDCFQNGCDTDHGRKDQAGWDRLAREFVEVAHDALGERAVVVVLESEFNKGGLQRSQELDSALAAKADFFHNELSRCRIVLGFGAWAQGGWGEFDEAAEAADAIGIQALRASTENSAYSYGDLANRTLLAARNMQSLFGKSIVITDLGLSSYPDAAAADDQARAMASFSVLDEPFRDAGVDTVVYRSFRDTPTMSTENYFGEAEKHWGLAWENGTTKPVFAEWKHWVRGEPARPDVVIEWRDGTLPTG